MTKLGLDDHPYYRYNSLITKYLSKRKSNILLKTPITIIE